MSDELTRLRAAARQSARLLSEALARMGNAALSGAKIHILLRGGTRLRMPDGRYVGAPYDKLLEAMKEMEVWSEDEQCWMNRWLVSAHIEKPQNAPHERPATKTL